MVLDLYPGTALMIRRAPPLLRFVVTGDDSRTLDALDQLDDTPKPGERVIVARREKEATPCHMKFGGKAKGNSGWYLMVKYTSVADPPPDAVVRDTERWRDWCRERAKRAA